MKMFFMDISYSIYPDIGSNLCDSSCIEFLISISKLSNFCLFIGNEAEIALICSYHLHHQSHISFHQGQNIFGVVHRLDNLLEEYHVGNSVPIANPGLENKQVHNWYIK